MDWLRVAEILCMIIACILWGISAVRTSKYEKEGYIKTDEVLLKYLKSQVVISFSASIFGIAVIVLHWIGS